MSDDWPIAGTLLATRYRLVELLETGGMAEIWRADDELLGRPVAVKLPTGPQVAWREARMAARMSHPGIAAVHDYREAVRADGTVAPFVVMELLAGETVAARLVRDPIGLPEAARIGAAVADALAAAHANGVVHRDVKPGNVMLTPNGVKILDFGISAPAGEPDDDDTGSTFGTPAYVAPERLDGKPAEPATDVYGLGVLLFEMVTGDPPYPVDTWEELAAAKATGPSTLPDTLPAEFRALVDRCLADDPAERPGAEEIRYDLTALWLTAHASETGTGPAAPSAAVEEPSWPVSPPSGEPTFFTGPQPTVTPRTNGNRSPFAPAATVPSGSGQVSSGSAQLSSGAGQLSSGSAQLSSGSAQLSSGSGAAGAEPVGATRAAMSGDGAASGRSAGASPGYAAGRAPAATIQLTPQPRRRVAVGVLVVALFAAVGGIFAAINWPRSGNQAAPEPPVQTVFSLPPQPSREPATTPPATSAPPSSKPAAPALSFDDALSRMRTAVEEGAEGGEIRSDVATDFLNLVRNLSVADDGDVDDQVAQLRQKIRQRAGEGSVSSAQSAVLQARLADLSRAAGT